MAGKNPRAHARKVFDHIVKTEVGAINRRRDSNQRAPLTLKEGPDGYVAGPKTPILEVAALALSGGGIRSASFSLGVLQAFNEHECFPRIDYLSTVSGGGYIGSAVTATMTKKQGEFVFGASTRREETVGARPADVKDTEEVGHLRNYSNYLIPFGARDVITALAIITRGLVANGAIVLAFALLIAALTVIGSPTRSGLLDPNVFGFLIADLPYLDWLDDNNFGIALILTLVGLPLFLSWAIWRSVQAAPVDAARIEFGIWWLLILIGYLLLAAASLLVHPQTAGIPRVATILMLLLSALCLIGMWALGRRPAPHHPRRGPKSYRRWWWGILASYIVLAAIWVGVSAYEEINLWMALFWSVPGLALLCWARMVGPSVRPQREREEQAEFRTWLPTLFALYLLIIVFFLITEFQPFVIAGMFDLAEAKDSTGSYSMLTGFIQWMATIAAPIAAVVTFFRQQIGTLFKSVTTSSKYTTKLLALGASAGVWIGGAALPLLLWVLYLYLSFWAISNDGKPGLPAQPPAIGSVTQEKQEDAAGPVVIKCDPGQQDTCLQQGGSEQKPAPAKPAEFDHSPPWLLVAGSSVSELVAGIVQYIWPPSESLAHFFGMPVTVLYVVLGLLLLLVSWILRPNANSLHQLYRDRLSKAFLFDPTRDAHEDRISVENVVDRTFAPIGGMPISELAGDTPYAPYQLINATLNVQGSDYANRRGRNSDFFLFSPCFVGSEATHYAETRAMEQATNLDLATAMAISGAAFSPNAGAASIRPLTPTLALLNVRTGYWLKNPRLLAFDTPHGERRPQRNRNLYLWAELTGRLYETSDEVFVSDGGHIENLGVYELLRRRCRVIITVDAEADPAMRYPSFITLQRYARIDLGVRINMPWDDIRKTTLRWMGYTGDPTAAENDPKGSAATPKPSSGPHVAIGTIEYDGGETGWLVYIKASLTGDENDYVRDYARRHDQFPHESTGDQFFSEEQFEVYRALGFHIANRLLNGVDVAQVYDEEKQCVHLNIRAQHPNVDPVRRALFKQ